MMMDDALPENHLTRISQRVLAPPGLVFEFTFILRILQVGDNR